MPPRLDFEFWYTDTPRIIAMVRSPSSGQSLPAFCLIDTGADVTLFDQELAEALDIDLRGAEQASVNGLGGTTIVRLSAVELHLLNEPELTVTVRAGFAELGSLALGNLIGLDVLEHFDFAISHRERLGYLGRSA